MLLNTVQCTEQPSSQRIHKPKMSVMLKLRNSGLGLSLECCTIMLESMFLYAKGFAKLFKTQKYFSVFNSSLSFLHQVPCHNPPK